MTPEEKFKRLRFLELKSKMGGAAAAKTMNDLAPPQRVDPGAARSAILGAAQGGTADFADELGGVAGGVMIGDGARLTPSAKAELLARGEKIPDQRGGRELTRDNIRDEDKRAQEFNPGVNMAGRVGAGLASAYVLPGGAAKSIGGMMKVGTGYGALGGLGASEADLEGGEYGRALLDTGVGGLSGGVLSGAAGAGLKVAPSLLNYLSGATYQGSLNKGRNVLLNGADQLSNNKPIPDAVVLRALNEGHIKPFGTTQGAATRLERALDEAGDTYGATVTRLEDLGAQGPDALELAQQFSARARDLSGRSGDPRIPNLYATEAEKVLDTAANNATANTTGKLPLRDAENYKRDLQNLARYNKTDATQTPLDPHRREAASTFRQAIEDSIERDAQAAGGAGTGNPLADVAATFIPVKTRYGELAQALQAAEKGVARGSQRTSSSLLPDTGALGDILGAGVSPAALLAKPATGALKSRLPSTLARAGLPLSELLGALSRATARGAASSSVRSTAAKAGGLSPDEVNAIVDWLQKK